MDKKIEEYKKSQLETLKLEGELQKKLKELYEVRKCLMKRSSSDISEGFVVVKKGEDRLVPDVCWDDGSEWSDQMWSRWDGGRFEDSRNLYWGRWYPWSMEFHALLEFHTEMENGRYADVEVGDLTTPEE